MGLRRWGVWPGVVLCRCPVGLQRKPRSRNVFVENRAAASWLRHCAILRAGSRVRRLLCRKSPAGDPRAVVRARPALAALGAQQTPAWGCLGICTEPSAFEIVHRDPKASLSARKVSWFLSVTCGTPMGSLHGETGKFRVLEPSVGPLGEPSHHGGRLKTPSLGWGLPWPPSGSQAPRGQLDAQPLPCPRCGGHSCAPGTGPTSLMPHSGQCIEGQWPSSQA